MLDKRQQKSFLDRFLTVLPHRPYCSDDLSTGISPRGLEEAKSRKYLQINPPFHQHYLIFDVDRPAAAFAWEDSHLATPNYAAINPKNGHAHLVYKLTVPITTSEKGRSKPIKYLKAIERAYRVELGADPGYKGLITRNPYEAHTLCLHTQAYDLGELVVWLKHDLSSYGVMEKEIDTVGMGRNSTVFENTRFWAYKAIRLYRTERRSHLRGVWEEEVLQYALAQNADFPYPLSYSEVKATAKSIAKFCWKMDAEAEREFLQRQAWRGRKGGKESGLVRAKASEVKRAQARLLSAKGLSQRAIAKELGVSAGSVNSWLK